MDNVLYNLNFLKKVNKLYLKLIIKNDNLETLFDFYNSICLFNDYFKFNETEKLNRGKYFNIIQEKIISFSKLLKDNETNLKNTEITLL